jgi:hypothetical protein
MPQGNAFSSSSRSQMGSSATTNINVGGGNKKAGFPYQVGRTSWTSIHFGITDVVNKHCCGLSSYKYTKLPRANISRPIGSTTRPGTYWNIPGTGAH